MWLLLMTVVTMSGETVSYDQGVYPTRQQCLRMRDAMEDTDFKDLDNIKITCVKLEKE